MGPKFPVSVTVVQSKGQTLKNEYLHMVTETKDQQPSQAERSLNFITQLSIVIQIVSDIRKSRVWSVQSVSQLGSRAVGFPTC